MIQQYLNAGLVDEFHLAVAPVLLGDGLRPFDRVDVGRISIEPLTPFVRRASRT